MIAPAPRHSYTFEEYLQIEEVARVRHEYYAGPIYAMAGGTPEHAALSAAITALLASQLASKPCRVGQVAVVDAIGCTLAVDDVYAAASDA